MRALLKSASYLFYPMGIPFIGALFYFLVSPRFFPPSIKVAKLFAILILTTVIPLLFLLLIKNLKLVRSIRLTKTMERRLPLLFLGLVLTTIDNFIISEGFPELQLFFSGLLISIGIAFCLTFVNYKVSLHMIGISALFGFILSISMLYSLNLSLLIALSVFSMGCTASSRIQSQTHKNLEIAVGWLLGILPQALFFTAEVLRYKM